MGLRKLDRISESTVADNGYWKYKIDEYNLPSGKQGKYHYVDSRGSVFVIPYFEGKFTFVNQFRYLNQKESLEFPGGGVKEGDTPYETALMELKEEAGLISDKMDFIGSHNPFNGVTNEICNVYYTENLKQSEQNLDESEEIEIVRLSYNEVKDYIKQNRIWDGMTLAAWSLFVCSNFNRE